MPTFASCFIYYPLNGCEKGVALDISNTGIRVRFRHKVVFPDRVIVHVPALNLRCEATIVRQDYFDVGFEFMKIQNINFDRLNDN